MESPGGGVKSTTSSPWADLVPAQEPQNSTAPKAGSEPKVGIVAGLGRPKFELVTKVGDPLPLFGAIPASWNPYGRAGEDFARPTVVTLPTPAKPVPGEGSRPPPPALTQPVPADAPILKPGPFAPWPPAQAPPPPPPPDHYNGPMITTPFTGLSQPKDVADYQIQLMNWMQYHRYQKSYHTHDVDQNGTIVQVYKDWHDSDSHIRDYAGKSGYMQGWWNGFG